jgi:hypothetical protein
MVAICFVLIAAAPTGLTGCSRNRSTRRVDEPPPTVVQVSNNNFLDIVVYVVQRGQRIRLGTATSNRATNFVIPSHVFFGPTPISFVVDPVGSGRVQSTGEIVVDAGEELELRLDGGRLSLTRK